MFLFGGDKDSKLVFLTQFHLIIILSLFVSFPSLSEGILHHSDTFNYFSYRKPQMWLGKCYKSALRWLDSYGQF